MSTEAYPLEDIAEITLSVWHRDISSDDATNQITDLIDAYTAANAREALEAAAQACEALKSMRAYLSKCPPHSEDRTGAEWGRVMDVSGAALARAGGKS
ncbi:hypothetical protein [Castellaniella sp. S9]|uniref:hypothetical protein n=1 Tax=Castellaniella sp. S9 TaxID=2993652 RepID=UPI0022B4D107|nr:hypothetical protein [Castellaniella sp. S9]